MCILQKWFSSFVFLLLLVVLVSLVLDFNNFYVFLVGLSFDLDILLVFLMLFLVLFVSLLFDLLLLLGDWLVPSIDSMVCDGVLMRDEEESRDDSTEHGSENVHSPEVVAPVIVVFAQHRRCEHGLAEADGGVEGSTGVGACDEDHSGERESLDSAAEDSESVLSGNGDTADVVLDEEDRSDEDAGDDHLHGHGLFPLVGTGLQVGELGVVDDFAVCLLALEDAEEDLHGEESATYLAGHHVESLEDQAAEGTVLAGRADSVDEDAEGDGGVHVAAGDGRAEEEEEEEGEADGCWVGRAGVDGTD